jgi:hypothetical protein
VRRRHAVITATAAEAAPALRQNRRSQGGLRSSFSVNLRRATINQRGPTASTRRQAIKIVPDVTWLVREGKLTPEQAEELKALASRDIGTLAINILMSFGAIAVAAGTLALNPTFSTGAAIGVALVVIGLAVSFGAGERWSLPQQHRVLSRHLHADRDRTDDNSRVFCRVGPCRLPCRQPGRAGL